jgi:hypothetical protein
VDLVRSQTLIFYDHLSKLLHHKKLYHAHFVLNGSYQTHSLSLAFSIFLVASWRVKETERMIAVCTELRKVSSSCFLYI